MFGRMQQTHDSENFLTSMQNLFHTDRPVLTPLPCMLSKCFAEVILAIAAHCSETKKKKKTIILRLHNTRDIRQSTHKK